MSAHTLQDDVSMETLFQNLPAVVGEAFRKRSKKLQESKEVLSPDCYDIHPMKVGLPREGIDFGDSIITRAISGMNPLASSIDYFFERKHNLDSHLLNGAIAGYEKGAGVIDKMDQKSDEWIIKQLNSKSKIKNAAGWLVGLIKKY